MVLSRLKGLLLQLDLFWSTDYFRYRQQSQYRTLTGGTCSLILIVLCIVLFSSSILGTFHKDNIAWQYGITQQTDNQFTVTTNTDTSSKFMFAIGINGLDLTATPRYFDFSLTQEISINGNTSELNYSLQPCRRQDWIGAGSKILEIFDRKNFSSFLCPIKGKTFSITGMSTSTSYKFMRVSVLQCDPTSPLAAISPCANTSLLNDFLQTHANFELNFYFVNALINPSDPTQIRYYLEDRNYVPFNFNYGGEVNLYMSKYSISTDEQILPYEQLRNSQGGVVNYVGQYIPSRKFGNLFGRVNIKKSSLSIDIQRNYTKLDSTLSYIGGLFGFIIVFFFFMRVYTQYSYEVQMADRLYSYDRDDPLKSKQFHFATFIGYILFLIGSFFGEVRWSTMKKYDECRQEIQRQFDVCFLMRRLIFLQRSLRVLFEDHQFKGLHLHDKLTLKQAQELRGFYFLRNKMKGEGEDGETEEKISQQSACMNVTEDLLENNEALQREDSSGLGIDAKGQKGTNKRGSSVQLQLSEKHRSMMNDSEAMLQPATSLRNNPPKQSTKQLPSPSSSSGLTHPLKLLHKQSQSGNRISKRIYEGFNTDLLRNILLKIEQDREEQKTQKNQILINQNQQDFQIRISKRRVRPRETYKEENEGKVEEEEEEPKKEVKAVRVRPHEQLEPNSPLEIKMVNSHTNQVSNQFQFIP